MRTLFALAGVAICCVAFGQAQTTLTSAGGSYTFHANSYTGSAASLGGGADFFANGVAQDFAFRDMWAYRIQGDSREYMVRSNNATFNNTASDWHATMFKGQNGSDTSTPMVQIDVYYQLGALSATTPILFKCVTLTNLTNQNLDFALFHYMDYDIPGTADPDFFSLHTFNGSTDLVQQRDTIQSGNYMETSFTGVGGPVSYQHGPLYGAFFTNPTIDTMNFSVDPGAGDFAVGFQLEATLAPGQTSVCPGCYTTLNGSVPEPTTLLAICVGVAGLTARHRRRRRS